MSLQHFFLKSQDIAKEIEQSGNLGFNLDLSNEDLHHVKVLRLMPGEHLGVVDAQYNFFECEILSLDDGVFVKNCIKKDIDSGSDIWLCPGLSKANKLDDVIRASTEIGIKGFIPTVFDRSVVKLDDKKVKIRMDRWFKIAKSAAMQSGQYVIPRIKYADSVYSLCATLKEFDFVIICWELSNDTNKMFEACNKIKDKAKHPKIAIIVGPEGGISEDEVKQIKKASSQSEVVSLGSSILRTETAGIVAPAIINYLLTC